MKRTWTIIGVRDVTGSFKWYQSLFGQPEARPARDDFGQIRDSDGTVVALCRRKGLTMSPASKSKPRNVVPVHGGFVDPS